MSAPQQNKRHKLKLARLEIASELLKRGYSYRKIREEVMRRLDLRTYALDTVMKDVHSLMAEWREFRLSNVDDLVQLELERIDDSVLELWEQWELSKEDHEQSVTTKKATKDGKIKGDKRTQIEERTANVRGLGNVSYITEIRAQLVERRRLLGLYSPEKAIVKTESDMSKDDVLAELQRLKLLQEGEPL